MSKKKLKELHVSDLYQLIVDGDKNALNELIQRQQKGRSIRFYPNGRSGPFDDGMIPIVIDICDDSVCIRSGQPHRSVFVDREVALKWLVGIPKCLGHLVSKYKDLGLDDEDIEFEVDQMSTKNFRHEVVASPNGEDGAYFQFFPVGMESWKVNAQNCCDLVKSLCDLCYAQEWDFKDKVTDTQYEAIFAMYTQAL